MNNSEARMIYENARKSLNKALGIKGDDVTSHFKVTPSTYRFEQPLVVGNSLYQFPLLANQEIYSNLETRLQPTDTAVIHQIGIFTGTPGSLADTAWLPDSYNSPVKYGAAPAAALATFWNGNLMLSVDNNVLIPKWDLLKHFSSPETQQTAALGTASPSDQFRGSYDGFYPMEPNITLIGGKNNTLQLSLPQGGLTAVKALSRAIIIIRCIIAQSTTG